MTLPELKELLDGCIRIEATIPEIAHNVFWYKNKKHIATACYMVQGANIFLVEGVARPTLVASEGDARALCTCGTLKDIKDFL